MHLLIIEARFYDDLADELLKGAAAAIKRAGGTHEVVTVPGALEIPGALAMAVRSMKAGRGGYDGFVLLGCIIRGETGHYDIVANESARGMPKGYDGTGEPSLAVEVALFCDPSGELPRAGFKGSSMGSG